MTTDQQVKLLMTLIKKGLPLVTAAAKAGMSEGTARKYRRSGKVPSELRVAHPVRTRRQQRQGGCVFDRSTRRVKTFALVLWICGRVLRTGSSRGRRGCQSLFPLNRGSVNDCRRWLPPKWRSSELGCAK